MREGWKFLDTRGGICNLRGRKIMFYSHPPYERPSVVPRWLRDTVACPAIFLPLLLLHEHGSGQGFPFSIPTPHRQNKHVMLTAHIVVSLAEGFVDYCGL